LGRKQNRRLAREKTENEIEEAVVDHLQEVAERNEEYRRRRDGRRQTGSIARNLMDTAVGNAIDNLPRGSGKLKELGVGILALSEAEKADTEKRSEAFLMRFQGQADVPGTGGGRFATQTAQEQTRRAVSPTGYPVFHSPRKRRCDGEEAPAQGEHSIEGSTSVTESLGAARRRKRPKNSKQIEYDAMVDEMVKKFEASKRSGKNSNVSLSHYS